MNSRSCGRRGEWLLAVMMASMAWQPAGAALYAIDPGATTADFDVRFLGLFPLHGKFLRTSGTLSYDRATRQGSIEVFIDTTTLVATNANAQALARGPEFFEVEKYPTIEFKSSRFVFDASRLKFIEGSLTLVGNTRPVVLTVTDSRCEAATENDPASCHAAAELVVKRSAFGMKAWAHTVSEEVTIRIAITARQFAEKIPAAEPPAESSRREPGPPTNGRPAVGNVLR